MKWTESTRRAPTVALVTSSPLRCADPRMKLVLSLCASLTVMLSLQRLVVGMSLYVLLLLWARLLPAAAQQVWRLRWVLSLLFVLDCLLISAELAVVVTLRLVLLAGAFALFFSTTTPDELRLALEWLRLPYRYAFSLSLAFQSVTLLDDEWRAIREAQQARGAVVSFTGWRNWSQQAHDLVALSVPAIVMVTKRAWAATEAAYARGFDSPHRQPYRRLQMRPADWLLLSAAIAATATLMLWPSL